MQVGDTFNIIWNNSKHRCRIIDIILSDRNSCSICIVDLLGENRSGYRTSFFKEDLIKLKKKAGSTWSVKPRSPRA